MTSNQTKRPGMVLLPPKKGVCQVCATDHPAEYPHNATSLYYQFSFLNEHGRSPNWDDAMAHCSDEMKANWKQSLRDMGVDVDNGKLTPPKEKASE